MNSGLKDAKQCNNARMERINAKNQKEERTKSELPYAHKHEKNSAFDLPLNEKVWQLKPTVLAPRFFRGVCRNRQRPNLDTLISIWSHVPIWPL